MASNWYQQVQLLSVLKILAFKIIMSIIDQILVHQLFELECECGQKYDWPPMMVFIKLEESFKGEDGNVIMLMLTINDPEIHKII